MSQDETPARDLTSGDLVLVVCHYYAKTGKWKYTGAAYFPKTLFENCIYPSEYGKKLRELNKLPGLRSGTWSDFFTVEVEDKYSELVLPLEQRDHE
jgi:hypothetical protein